MWDLSALTRDWTLTPYSGSAALITGLPREPLQRWLYGDVQSPSEHVGAPPRLGVARAQDLPGELCLSLEVVAGTTGLRHEVPRDGTVQRTEQEQAGQAVGCTVDSPWAEGGGTEPARPRAPTALSSLISFPAESHCPLFSPPNYPWDPPPPRFWDCFAQTCWWLTSPMDSDVLLLLFEALLSFSGTSPSPSSLQGSSCPYNVGVLSSICSPLFSLQSYSRGDLPPKSLSSPHPPPQLQTPHIQLLAILEEPLFRVFWLLPDCESL